MMLHLNIRRGRFRFVSHAEGKHTCRAELQSESCATAQSGGEGQREVGGQLVCLEMMRFIFINVTPPPVCSKCHLRCFHVTVRYLLASSSASPSPPPPPRLLRLEKFGVKGEEEEDEGITCNQLIKPREQSSGGSS